MTNAENVRLTNAYLARPPPEQSEKLSAVTYKVIVIGHLRCTFFHLKKIDRQRALISFLSTTSQYNGARIT